jgi:tRNA-modifying protein YgfZ
MTGETDPNRVVLAISGPDREVFLQGLVTNDIRNLAQGPVYAAILTPQGKYLADFLLVQGPDGVIWLDVAAGLADDLLRRLTMYRLRAQVSIARTDLLVTRGLGAPPPDAVTDPRHPALGWRVYGVAGGSPVIDWDAIRVEHCIPESLVELVPNDTYILEAGFERLHGVDFRKGCYVGQEVTARMKHKTELRKGFVTVSVSGAATAGDAVTAGGRDVGTLFTRAGDRAIAWLRLDRAEGEMQAGDAVVRLIG